MEEYGNNGIFDVDRKQMQAVDRKQEIYLEWPYNIQLAVSNLTKYSFIYFILYQKFRTESVANCTESKFKNVCTDYRALATHIATGSQLYSYKSCTVFQHL